PAIRHEIQRVALPEPTGLAAQPVGPPEPGLVYPAGIPVDALGQVINVAAASDDHWDVEAIGQLPHPALPDGGGYGRVPDVGVRCVDRLDHHVDVGLVVTSRMPPGDVPVAVQGTGDRQAGERVDQVLRSPLWRTFTAPEQEVREPVVR